MTDSFVGRTLGKYQVLEKLGQGGMGKVYKGRQISLNRPVAIKVLTAQMAMDPEFVERFQQEARVIATLQHENIVHVYDIDETRNADGEAIYFIVMEFVDGYHLGERPGAPAPMSPDQVTTVGAAVAGALDYAHRRGIVHRDIKAANVMVTREGQIKLMDFGIAKSAGGVKTATGSVLGTPEYMAPEQARSGEVTARSDIYSLGVLLYEMSTGQLPFRGHDPFAIALKHISEDVPPPRSIAPSVPEGLDAVIRRALAKEPAQRFASAQELADHLLALDLGTARLPVPPTEEASQSPSSTPSQPPRFTPAYAPPEPPGAQAPTLPTPPPQPPSAQAPTLPTPPAVDVAPTLPMGSPTPPPSPAAATSAADPIASPPAAAQPLTGPPQQAAPGHGPPPPPLPGDPPARRPEDAAAGTRSKPWALWVLAPVAVLAVAALGFHLGRDDPPTTPTVEASTEAADSLRQAALDTAKGHLEAGRLAEARAALAPVLSADANDGDARALEGRIDQAARHEEALGILEEAREGTEQTLTEWPAGEAAPPETSPEPGRSTAPRPTTAPPAPASAPPPKAAEPRVSAAELWSRARRLKSDDAYHSLRRTLDQLIATGRANNDAHRWRSRVDGWIEDREEDLRDELEDHLDDLADAIEGEDMDDLEELWGDRPDTGTRRAFQGLWKRWRKLDVEIQVTRDSCVDNRIDFTAQFTIRGRQSRREEWRQVRRGSWRGRFVDDDRGERFTSPWAGS